MLPRVICFIGSGAMASAVADGLLASAAPLFQEYVFVDPDPAQLAKVSARQNATCTGYRTPALALEHLHATPCRVVFLLAVKPQAAAAVAKDLAPFLSDAHTVLSIMAGVRLGTLRSLLGPQCRLVRVMPNAALMVGHGASAFAADVSATADDIAVTRRIFSAAGYCAEVSEGLLDAVTGLAGSGPAYVAVFVEALADGGVRMGLPRPLARDLAVHTVLGSGKMLLQPQYASPAVLKDLVASPGGTTMAGLAALEAHRLRFAAIDAVRAATQRAQELSKL